MSLCCNLGLLFLVLFNVGFRNRFLLPLRSSPSTFGWAFLLCTLKTWVLLSLACFLSSLVYIICVSSRHKTYSKYWSGQCLKIRPLEVFWFSSPKMKISAAISHFFENRSHSLGVTSHLCLKCPCTCHGP